MINYYDITKKILFGSEVTLTNDKEAYLGRYDEIVDYNFCFALTTREIIELDSGNWETGEEHYKLNEKFIRWEKSTRFILINILESDLEKATSYIQPQTITYHLTEFLNAVKVIKLNDMRKQKIKKLNGTLDNR